MVREVVVAGVGQTEFGSLDSTIRQLGSDATRAALADSPFDKNDIEVAYVGNVGTPAAEQGGIVGQVCLREVGITGISITNLENACSSASSAFKQAYHGIASGLYDVAIALGVEKMTGVPSEEALGDTSSDTELEMERGMTYPALYAMRANAYQAEYEPEGLREAMTEVAIKNHANAMKNPNAHFHRELTAEDVLDSPMVAEPLRVFDMCPISDGGAAAILAAPEALPAVPDPKITVEASVHRTGEYDDPENRLSFVSGVEKTGAEAYDQAGITPEDVDLFEVHDASTLAEIQLSEALGICDPGSGVDHVLEGKTALDGETPISPSGGLKARGHPIGATGVAQLSELVWQLRGEAGDRQVTDAQIGLAENGGGALNGVGANLTVHILKAH